MGLICCTAIYKYPIPMDKKHLQNFCGLLCLAEMPREAMIRELDAAKEMFSNHDRKFVQECPSGLITLHEFRKYFCDCTVGSGSSEYAEQLFRALDNNGDGIVDFREYVTAISMLAQGTPEDKLRWSFRLYDKDRDGSITRAEMLEIMKAVHKMSVAASITNLNPITAEECTNRIFIRLDKDHNAEISLEEFVEGSLDDDWIREMLECDLSTVQIQTTPKCDQLHPRVSRESLINTFP